MLKELQAVSKGKSKISSEANGIGDSILGFLGPDYSANLKRDLIAAIYQEKNELSRHDISGPRISAKRQERLSTAFILRLAYPGMEDRSERVASAYDETFEWIFKESLAEQQSTSWQSFKAWLESSKQLYWITGKAGSGKSTLMKFIMSTQKSKTEHHLKAWSGDSDLITATFFFWDSGTALQKSQRGLFLTLLTQILRRRPNLIPIICPQHWEALCLFGDDPQSLSDHELLQMLIDSARALSDAKLCIFVDGLDEFNDDHKQLINLFRDLTKNENVKLCVASRPWVVFEDAFAQGPNLMLHELTYGDIKHFVSDRFQNDTNFALLQRREADYASQLIESVVSKASGVFLWVNLVVSSLLAGMSYGDRVCDLQQRLDLLPPDLGRLYEKILDGLDPFYLSHAAQLFNLVLASPQPVSVFFLSFVDEEYTFALKHPIKELTWDEIQLRSDTMRRRLNSRCKGLLEVGQLDEDSDPAWGGSVQFLHRTVKDYIQSEYARKKLGQITPDFDPNLDLCAGSLALIKSLKIATELDSGRFSLLVDYCLSMASLTQAKHSTKIIELLDELDRTGCELKDKLILTENVRDLYNGYHISEGSWARLCAGGCHIFGGTFLSLATRFGITPYVQAKVREQFIVQKDMHDVGTVQWPLLIDAVLPYQAWRSPFIKHQPNPDVVACLLAKSAGPNDFYTRWEWPKKKTSLRFTSWDIVLVGMLTSFDGESLPQPWAKISALMLSQGAKLNKSTIQDALDRMSRYLAMFDERPVYHVDSMYAALRVIQKAQRKQRGLLFWL